MGKTRPTGLHALYLRTIKAVSTTLGLGAVYCRLRHHRVARQTVRHDFGNWTGRCSRCGVGLARMSRDVPWKAR